MGDGIFKDELSRREAMKTALKAGAYAAPVILAASVPVAGVAAATPPPPPIACTLSGEAFGLNAVVAPILSLNKVGDVVLPPGGTVTVASAGVPLVLTTGVITDTTTNTSTTPARPSVASSSTVDNLSLLGGTITATVLRSVATSSGNGTTASSSPTGTMFTNLVIAGNVQPVNPAPNTTVTIPGVATVVLNEQIPTGNGTTTTGLTVNALHVTLTTATLGLPVGAEIIVASARSGVSC